MPAILIALESDKKKLGELFAPERKRQISEDAKQRDKDDRRNPESSLSGAKSLGMDTGDRTSEDDQPNDGQANPHLSVELRGMQTESVENFAH